MLLGLLLVLPQTPTPAAPAAAADPLADVRVTARLEATELVVGSEASVRVVLEVGDASASEAGIPAPILQLDVPPSVELVGRRLTDLKELARNEFLDQPYERLLEGLEAEVRFTLVAAPEPDETLGLNVVGYLTTADGDVFLRRRLELPLRAGATAVPGSAADSSWGPGEERLDIGDRAPLFELPRADGSRVALGQFRGDKRVVVTTYRAHW